jgi:hypothetical protein
VSASASTVTYVRNGDGNLVKVRRPTHGASSPNRSGRSPALAGRSPWRTTERSEVKPKAQSPDMAATTKPSAEPPRANSRRAIKPRSDAPAWTLPIPRVVRRVAESVGARYGVTVGAILSGERFPNTVRARHEWWRLVRDTWDLSYPETGRLVGGVDHTTILSALREREVGARKVGAEVVKNKDANHTRMMSPNRPVGTL